MPKNERGLIPLIILIVALGIFAILVITSFFSFRNKLFSTLYTKPQSFAAETVPASLTPVDINIVDFAKTHGYPTDPTLTYKTLIGGKNAIQAAIDSFQVQITPPPPATPYISYRGARIFFPVGDYDIGTGTIIVRGAIQLIGSATGNDGASYTGSRIVKTGSGAAIKIQDGVATTGGFVISDLNIDGLGGASGGDTGIEIGNGGTGIVAASGTLSNLLVLRFKTGVRIIGSQETVFNKVNAENNIGDGFVFDTSINGTNTTTTFISCRASSNGGVGLHIKRGYTLTFNGFIGEYNGQEGILIEKQPTSNEHGIFGPFTFNQPYFEGNNTQRSNQFQFKAYSLAPPLRMNNIQINNPFFAIENYNGQTGNKDIFLRDGQFILWYPHYYANNSPPAHPNPVQIGTNVNVDIYDFQKIAADYVIDPASTANVNWLREGAGVVKPGDINKDGLVNVIDYGIFVANFGK